MSKDLFYEMREGSFYNHEQDTSTYWEKDNMICRLEHQSENVQFIYKLDKAEKLRILRDMIDKRNEYMEDRKSSRDYKITLFVLISLIVFLLVGTLTLNAQKTVNTDITYSEDRYRYFEDNDCSVRAYAEVFNISYRESIEAMKLSGRKRGNLMKLKDFIRHIFEYKKDELKELIYLNYYYDNIRSKDFVKHYAEEGYSYFVISEGHIFVIEQNTDGDWVVKGGVNDKYLRILGWLKFENKLI